MSYELIFLSKQGFELIPYLFWILECMKMEQQIPGDVDAHVSKSFIKLIQMLWFVNILLGFDYFSHGHPIQTFFTQGNLYICLPIEIIKGCKDSGSESYWILHFTAILINNYSINDWMYMQKHCKKNQFELIYLKHCSLRHAHFLWVYYT